ncbi:5101_t:CDS:1, partial [Cetraspora pellucida]
PDTNDSSICLKDVTDKSQIALRSVMKHVNITDIMKIWEVRHISTTSASLNYV